MKENSTFQIPKHLLIKEKETKRKKVNLDKADKLLMLPQI